MRLDQEDRLKKSFYSAKSYFCRATLVDNLLDRFEKNNILLLTSPPQTGKSYMAALLGRALVEKHKENVENDVLVVNIALSQVGNVDFGILFEAMTGVQWHDLITTIPQRRMVYLIVDDVHTMAASQASALWQFVHKVHSERVSRVKILLFGSYEPTKLVDGVSVPLCDKEVVVEPFLLYFKEQEVLDYVAKSFAWLLIAETPMGSGLSALQVFLAPVSGFSRAAT